VTDDQTTAPPRAPEEDPRPVSPAVPGPVSPAVPAPISPAVPAPISPANPDPAEPSEPSPGEPTPRPGEPSPGEPTPRPGEPSPGEPAPRPGEPGPRPGEAQPGGPEPVLPVPVSPGVGPISPEDADLSPGTIRATEAAEQEPAARPAARPAEAGEWRGIVLVTGTDTDVGKTIVTSAIAAAAQAAGLRVAVVKPGQTGTAQGGPTDIDLITRLAHPHTTRTLASYPEPLAPLAAAQVAGMAPLELYEVVDAIRAEAEKHDLVLVEGAGGLLVPMGVRPSGAPWTVADLATTLGGQTVVVARAGLGTLNHTALTLEALERRGVPAGVVLGAWPAEPELVHWANLTELAPHLVGALPDGAGGMDPGVFQRSAPGWLTPALYGVLDDWRVWADEVS
jgi:dethiobiotin synthetase